jgi:putative heme iron utilization protein
LELPDANVSARNLMEHALYGDLVTKMSPMEHRRAGWPVASLVDFATDSEGTPIFSLSPMAMHTRNAKADPRSSLVVEMPGWRGLASARVTLFGTVKQVPAEMQDMARGLFKKKHKEENASYGTSEFPMYILAVGLLKNTSSLHGVRQFNV